MAKVWQIGKHFSKSNPMLSSATIWLRAPFQQLHRRATKVCHSNRSRWCVTGGRKHILEKRRSDMIFATSGKKPKNPQPLAQKSWEFVMKKDAPKGNQPGQGDGSRRMFRATPKASWWDVKIFDFSRLKVIHLGKSTFEPPKMEV